MSKEPPSLTKWCFRVVVWPLEVLWKWLARREKATKRFIAMIWAHKNAGTDRGISTNVLLPLWLKPIKFFISQHSGQEYLAVSYRHMAKSEWQKHYQWGLFPKTKEILFGWKETHEPPRLKLACKRLERPQKTLSVSVAAGFLCSINTTTGPSSRSP